MRRGNNGHPRLRRPEERSRCGGTGITDGWGWGAKRGRAAGRTGKAEGGGDGGELGGKMAERKRIAMRMVYSTGLNDQGQLGLGDSNSPPYVSSPKEVVGFDRPVVAIAAAAFHSAAIDEAGQMYLWGGNAARQLGLGSRAPSKVHSPRVPEALVGVRIQHMALGGQHTLAVTADGQLLSWGKGLLGHGPLPLFSRLSRKSSESIPRLVKAMASTKVVHVAAGLMHSACVDDSGRLFMFGGNRFSQLGLGDEKDREEPVELTSLQHAVTDVACGGYHTAAVTGAGHLFTWGANEYGCLGHGPRHAPSSAVPVRVAGSLAGKQVLQVSCGWKHTAAIASGADEGEGQSLRAATVGKLYTWGWGGSQGSHAVESRSTGGQLFSRGSKDRAQTTPAFESFKNNYLLVYCLMMAGDWLQGPYVYALYQHYGYDKGDIGRLFIAGFGSSMVFGTIVGSLADRHGRRLACVLYCITYILSCLTKHFPAFSILVLGRVLGGIATSLLFSSFESWLVAEHFARGFEPPWLSITFSKAIFLGNGLVAILSGLVANVLVTDLNLGPVAPFDAASVLLAGGMAVIVGTWSENYGDSDQSHGLLLQFQLAYHAIASDEKIAILGAIQSLFEASMYTFVFLWTPALAPSQQAIPHGFIFSLFMLASMLGSSLASRLMGRAGLKVEVYMQAVFAISSLSLLLPCIVNWFLEPHPPPGGGITAGGRVQLAGFCVFEACVGVFWPSLMRMRAQYLPEESRSTIMNFFRVPLNVFVCLVLYHVRAFPMTAMFLMCSLFLAIAALLQRRLLHLALSALPQ
ncbi:unnamed protein product, partial [Closterium sp. Naga37s-1]